MNDQLIKFSLGVFRGSQKTHGTDSGEIRKDRKEDLLVRLGIGGGGGLPGGPFWLSFRVAVSFSCPLIILQEVT